MNDTYVILNHDYINTGGHCMVSIFTVYDTQEKALRYACCNEEGMNWQTIDTIGHEPPADLTYDEVILSFIDWDSIDYTSDDDFTKLLKYCRFEYYKCYCVTFKSKISVTPDSLTPELLDFVTAHMVEWHKDHNCDFYTDGYCVFPHELYVSPEESAYDQQLKDLKDFKRWYDTLVDNDQSDENIQKLYDEGFITIAIAGRYISVPFNADTYNNVEYVLRRIIEEF